MIPTFPARDTLKLGIKEDDLEPLKSVIKLKVEFVDQCNRDKAAVKYKLTEELLIVHPELESMWSTTGLQPRRNFGQEGCLYHLG